MIGRPVEHKVVYEFINHSLALELRRFTGTDLLQIASASNYLGFSSRHFYMLPLWNLDEHRLRSSINGIVKVIKSRRGNGHIPSWIPPLSFLCQPNMIVRTFLHYQKIVRLDGGSRRRMSLRVRMMHRDCKLEQR